MVKWIQTEGRYFFILSLYRYGHGEKERVDTLFFHKSRHNAIKLNYSNTPSDILLFIITLNDYQILNQTTRVSHICLKTPNILMIPKFGENILWTDEPKAELFGRFESCYCCQKTNTALHKENMIPTVIHEFCSLCHHFMPWSSRALRLCMGTMIRTSTPQQVHLRMAKITKTQNVVFWFLV